MPKKVKEEGEGAPVIEEAPAVAVPHEITIEERAEKRRAEFAERSKDWETRPLADLTHTLWKGPTGHIFIVEEVSLGEFRTRLIIRAS